MTFEGKAIKNVFRVKHLTSSDSLISLVYIQKILITFDHIQLSHNTLDHSRLGPQNKFLENKSGQLFCIRQV